MRDLILVLSLIGALFTQGCGASRPTGFAGSDVANSTQRRDGLFEHLPRRMRGSFYFNNRGGVHRILWDAQFSFDMTLSKLEVLQKYANGSQRLPIGTILLKQKLRKKQNAGSLVIARFNLYIETPRSKHNPWERGFRRIRAEIASADSGTEYAMTRLGVPSSFYVQLNAEPLVKKIRWSLSLPVEPDLLETWTEVYARNVRMTRRINAEQHVRKVSVPVRM